jgi:hypothetical protein
MPRWSLCPGLYGRSDTAEILFYARGQICPFVLLPGIFARPFSGGIIFCTIDHRQTVSQWKWKCFSVSVTNEHGNGNVFPFCHPLKLAMKTKNVFPFLSSSFVTGNGNGNVFPFPANNRPTVICLRQVCICIGPQFMAHVFKVATTSNGTIIYSIGASLLSLFIAGTIIFSSLVIYLSLRRCLSATCQLVVALSLIVPPLPCVSSPHATASRDVPAGCCVASHHAALSFPRVRGDPQYGGGSAQARGD